MIHETEILACRTCLDYNIRYGYCKKLQCYINKNKSCDSHTENNNNNNKLIDINTDIITSIRKEESL